MKKRTIALLLVLAMLLAGCGSSKQPPTGTIKPASSSSQNVTAPPETEAQAEQDDRPVSLGRMEGGTYENAYTGYGCYLDSGWVYKSAEELQDISDLTQELLAGSEIDLSKSNLNQLTDMMAENVELMASMNVLYQQITPQEKLSFSFLGESEILDSILDSKDLLISSYAQAGIDVSSIEKVTVTFLGESRPAIHTSGTIQGTPYYVLQIFDYKLGGDYSVVLTMSSFVEDTTEQMLDLFYSVS